MPRADRNYLDQKMNIFVLDSALTYTVQGHQLFPDMDLFNHEGPIVTKSASHQFCEIDSPPNELRDSQNAGAEGITRL